MNTIYGNIHSWNLNSYIPYELFTDINPDFDLEFSHLKDMLNLNTLEPSENW
jgi:hypothetical protein